MTRKKALISSALALTMLFSLTGLVSAAPCAAEYTVQSGDWMWRIARALGVDPVELLLANPLVNPNLIYPGQKLCIPAQAASPATATPIPTATPAPIATPNAPATSPAPLSACNLGNGVWNPNDIPRFWIAAVERGKSVTIAAENFPPGVPFEVRMGAYGTLGIGGALVDTTNSCRGGAFRMTYTIPDGLRFSDQIAIRLENFFTGYHAFNYFWNFTSVAIP